MSRVSSYPNRGDLYDDEGDQLGNNLIPEETKNGSLSSTVAVQDL